MAFYVQICQARKAKRLPSKPLSPLKQARRERLLDAAEGVFQADGFRGASMERIAEAAAMSKVTLYGYFADKEAAFVAVAERFAKRLGSVFEAALAKPGDLAERLGDALVAKHQAVNDLVRRSSEANDLFATQARLARNVFATMDRDMMVQIALALEAEGCLDPERLARLLFAATQGVANAGSPAWATDVRYVVARLLGNASASAG